MLTVHQWKDLKVSACCKYNVAAQKHKRLVHNSLGRMRGLACAPCSQKRCWPQSRRQPEGVAAKEANMKRRHRRFRFVKRRLEARCGSDVQKKSDAACWWQNRISTIVDLFAADGALGANLQKAPESRLQPCFVQSQKFYKTIFIGTAGQPTNNETDSSLQEGGRQSGFPLSERAARHSGPSFADAPATWSMKHRNACPVFKHAHLFHERSQKGHEGLAR